MKARWVWSTWAHVALIVTLASEVVLIVGCVIFIVPKFEELAQGGWFNTADSEGRAITQWSLSVVNYAVYLCENAVWLVVVLALIWGLFEWRVRSENKSLMRLAGLGTLAVKLGIASILLAAALILPPIISAGPGNRFGAHRVAEARVADLDDATNLLDAAIAAHDRSHAAQLLDRMQKDFSVLQSTGLGQPIWETLDLEKGTSVDMRFKEVRTACSKAKTAAEREDDAHFEEAMKVFRAAYAALRPLAPGTASMPG